VEAEESWGGRGGTGRQAVEESSGFGKKGLKVYRSFEYDENTTRSQNIAKDRLRQL
jgi:hypothetical protein